MLAWPWNGPLILAFFIQFWWNLVYTSICWLPERWNSLSIFSPCAERKWKAEKPEKWWNSNRPQCVQSGKDVQMGIKIHLNRESSIATVTTKGQINHINFLIRRRESKKAPFTEAAHLEKAETEQFYFFYLWFRFQNHASFLSRPLYCSSENKHHKKWQVSLIF